MRSLRNSLSCASGKRRNKKEAIRSFMIAQDKYGFPEYVERTSLFSGVASMAVSLALLYFFCTYIAKAADKEFSTSRATEPRVDTTEAELYKFGVLLFDKTETGPFAGKNQGLNTSFVQVKFLLRSIFDGDNNNDVTPRIAKDLGATKCTVYEREGSEGKEAICPDRALVAPMHDHRFVETLTVKGRYGEPEYTFLQTVVELCLDGPEAGCASEEEMNEFVKTAILRMDVAINLPVSVTPETQVIWRNMYLDIPLDRNTGFETFFSRVEVDVEGTIPSFQDFNSSYSVFDSMEQRSSKRGGAEFAKVYFRIGDLVQKEKVTYYNLLNIFNDLGATSSWLSLIFGSFLLWVNKRYGRQFEQPEELPEELPYEDATREPAKMRDVAPGDAPQPPAMKVGFSDASVHSLNCSDAQRKGAQLRVSDHVTQARGSAVEITLNDSI